MECAPGHLLFVHPFWLLSRCGLAFYCFWKLTLLAKVIFYANCNFLIHILISLYLTFPARPVDLMRSRTRTNIPVQKIMEAQNMIDQQHNAVDIPVDNQPVAPTRNRPRRDDRRGGEKTVEELEGEAQDILERLKKIWAFEVWCSVHQQKPGARAQTSVLQMQVNDRVFA